MAKYDIMENSARLYGGRAAQNKKNGGYSPHHSNKAYQVQNKQTHIQHHQVDSPTLPTESRSNSRANEEQEGGIVAEYPDHCAYYINDCSQVRNIELVRTGQFKKLFHCFTSLAFLLYIDYIKISSICQWVKLIKFVIVGLKFLYVFNTNGYIYRL